MLTFSILSATKGKKPADVNSLLNRHRNDLFKTGLLSIFLILLVTITNAQGGYNTTNWRFSNPKQFGFTVFDLDFLDNNNVIAVGSEGGIAKSTDGGANWTYGVFTYTQPNGLYAKPQSFSDVHYVTANIAYAVGSTTGSSFSSYGGGVLAKTTDGGVTWSNVNNPLYANMRNINTVWFINKDTGYIAGQFNTPDSIPKLYVTRNGGATWDSLNAPIGGKVRVGYVNNPNMPSLVWDMNSKGKDIYRVEFLNDSVGYVIGGSNSGFNFFPNHPAVFTSGASACLPNGGTTTTAAQDAGLVWKITKGVLTDYSATKERLGYNGVYTAAVNCSTRYASNSIHTQVYRAMNIINDSTLVIMSFNNNIVIKINTGKNDSTLNINVPGVYEKGKYTLLNAPFPPNNNSSTSGPAIPVNQVLLASNPYYIRRAANGKLFAPTGSSVFAPASRMWTSVDTGRNWTEERCLPVGRNYSTFTNIAIDIAPNGRFLVAGANGVVADSTTGSQWNSNYITVPAAASYNGLEFADCDNGIVSGSSNITVTTDGGKTWIDKGRPEFAASFYTIGGMAYPTVSKAYFAVSNGVVYSSTDKATTLDPSLSDFNYRMNDVAAIGNDTVWAVGQSQFSVPAASRTSTVYRSYNGGLNWTQHGNFTLGSLSQTLTEIEFPSKLVGYTCGSRDTIWKTTDGGTTWFKLPLPTPGVTPQITYSDMQALSDNVVYITGNGFPRKVIFKTTDGGLTWTDVSAGVLAKYNESNIFGVRFHDVNNGYVALGRGSIFKTTDGGATWTMDFAPSSGFNAMAFAPRTVPASVTMTNRKLFVVGPSYPIMEYGNPANVNVNSTETIVNANCTNLSAGSITVNATGGIAPYTYSINGGAFQASNAFTGLTQGVKTIRVKDAYCGLLTKTVTVGFSDNLVLTTNNDTLVCAGAPVPMLASTNGTGASYLWTPAAGLSATNIPNPVATVNNPAAYTVTASLNGCVRNRTVNITIKANPTISAGPDKTILAGDVVGLQGSAISGTPQTIAWTPTASLISAPNALYVNAQPAVTTTYTLTIRDVNNCTSTDNALITVIPYCAKVMDAFTPNGDGFNDRWLVSTGAVCYTSVAVAVFNRYGGEVYKNDNYQNNWDGTYKGKPVADGTYYFAVTFKLINGRSVTLRGDVTILR